MKDGGPAFPIVGLEDRDGQGIIAVFNSGMTLRDYFAGQAIAGMMANERWIQCPDDGTVGTHLARNAYDMADSMLAERSK